ncbi:MAG: hypothetical protein CW338_02930 [Clostridiales bacterium]|nr:hypothetical protein [Clostridiales bacterium]
MSEERNLYDKALSNYSSARVLREHLSTDEGQLNVIAYLLQQSLELTLKYLLEQNGVEYPKTHDIEQLIRLGKKEDAPLYLTEYIEDHAEMFSQWEAKTRYIVGYMVEIEKIDRAIKELDVYFTKVTELLKAENE